MSKIDWKSVGRFMGHVGEGMLYTFAAVTAWKLSDRSDRYVVNPISVAGEYDEAVDVIMRSDMTSYYKSEAIEALKQDGSSAYYRSVAYIVNDDNTTDYYRLEMIKKLSK